MSDSQHPLETQLHGLWMRAQAGDGASYAQALRLLSTCLRGFLRKRMPNQAHDVEDLVQETLMAIHQKRHTYQTDQPLTAWVFAIARYKWVDHLRAQGRRGGPHEQMDDWADFLQTDSEAEASHTRRDLARMLDGLPPKQRAAIELTRLQGLSVTEAARQSGQSEASVKVNVHRGMKALMAKWKD